MKRGKWENRLWGEGKDETKEMKEPQPLIEFGVVHKNILNCNLFLTTRYNTPIFHH